MLLEAYEARLREQEVNEAYATHIVDLKEQIKLLRDRLFNRKSEQTVDPNTPQLAMFNEPESEPLLAVVERRDEMGNLSAFVPNKKRSALVSFPVRLIVAAAKPVGNSYDGGKGTVVAGKLVLLHSRAVGVGFQKHAIGAGESEDALVSVTDQ